MTIVTGAFKKMFEVWASPPERHLWNSTSSRELRKVRTYTSKEVAHDVCKVYRECSCVAEIREIYMPVDEIPLIEHSTHE